jgi:hypothetical protein
MSEYINEDELRFTLLRVPGQEAWEGDRGIRIEHTPSGISVTTTEGRSALQNKAVALEQLTEALRVKGVIHSNDPATTFEESLSKVFTEAQDLLLRKHHDYGPTNIGRSPGGPLNGIRVRLWDKQARINNLIDKGAEPANESLRDSFLDLMNYAAIALVVMDGNWPE